MMPELPADVVEYKRTAVFDRATVPPGLLRAHALKAGTWGEIVVLSGQVEYVVEAEPELRWQLSPGVPGTVTPSQRHHVALGEGATFYVRFLRAEPGPK